MIDHTQAAKLLQMLAGQISTTDKRSLDNEGMDRAARQALLPYSEIFSVDFTGGTTSTTEATSSSVLSLLKY